MLETAPRNKNSPVQKYLLLLQQINHSIKAIALLFIIVISLFIYLEYGVNTDEYDETLAVVSNPEINDIYFLNVRLISDNVRPNQKYRVAKVVDITGEIITLIYSDYFYQQKHAAVNSIKYGQLTYTNYFSGKRYDFPLSEIKKMQSREAIYLAKRPVNNKLYGNPVGPVPEKEIPNLLRLGIQENIKGEAFLKDKFNETRFEKAFVLFQQSSELGYVEGQINLAQMYLNGQYAKKDFNKALFWLKQAALQSNKTAILKYGIVCKQVLTCDLINFYQELSDIGVNIKIREVDFELSP